MLVPEVSLPRHSTVHGSYSLAVAAASTHHVKLAAVNSLGQRGLWSAVHSFVVRRGDNSLTGNNCKSFFYLV